MEKRELKPVGIESKLAGICLCLTFVVIEGFSMMGVYKSIEPYWLRSAIIEAMLLIPTLVFMYLGKKQYVSMLKFKPVKIRVILLAVLVEICIAPALTFLNMITMLFTPNVVEAALDSTTSEVPYGLMIMAMAVCPAFFEEMASRGIMLSAFKRSGRRFAAVLLSALCFALPHGNINQFFYAFAAGIVMCIVVEATDSIFTSISMHFITNCFSITLMYYLQYRNIVEARTEELFGGYAGTDLGEYLSIPDEILKPLMITVWVFSFLIVGTIAFFGIVAAYRLVGIMSCISGKYDYINKLIPQGGLFRLKSKKIQMREEKEASAGVPDRDVFPDIPKSKIMNPFLLAGILLWAGFIVFYELIVQGVIVLQ